MHTINKVTDSQDIKTVAVLAAEIWNEHFVDIIGQAQVDYMLNKFQSAQAISLHIENGQQYYLLEIDNEPAGYLALDPDSSTNRMMISKIYLKRASRGMGLGRELLNFAQQECLKSRCSALWLTVNIDNHATIEWYKRKGFSVIDKVKKDIGAGFFMDDLIMKISVPPTPGTDC